MYNNFFGFTEKPFKLVPDPVFLFLSRSHEEALAHLTYAISQGDGFVAITGEVGTGKTTLCRHFLESLDDTFEAAYIFNPKLDAIQLLKAINDEFGVVSEADTIKDLIDHLNAFLLKKKASGKKIILIIDEAHNLDYDVLEQIRLLSNLETTRQKLIQIILIGQPELDDMLDMPRLRQLEQRIALRYHIRPLNLRETRQYIEHRLAIASQKAPVEFTSAAIFQVYRYSAGIPRLINIVSDRVLLIAFCSEKKTMTRSLVRKAIHELSARRQRYSRRQWNWRPILTTAGILCGVVLIGTLAHFNYRSQSAPAGTRSNPQVLAETPDQQVVPELPSPGAGAPQPSPSPAIMTARMDTVPDEPREKEIYREKVGETKKAEQEINTPKVEEPKVEKTRVEEKKSRVAFSPLIITVENLGGVVDDLDPQTSKTEAVKAALGLWMEDAAPFVPPPTDSDGYSYFRSTALQNGLMALRIVGDLDLIARFNLPAILAFSSPEGGLPVYLTASRIEDSAITLLNGNSTMVIKESLLRTRWNGTAYVLWKDHLGIRNIIRLDTTGESVMTLKLLLHNIGFDHIPLNRVFDADAQMAVRAIQVKYGLIPDGIVGPMTKIALYNELDTFKMPSLTDFSEQESGDTLETTPS